jgi:hypothetical protein
VSFSANEREVNVLEKENKVRDKEHDDIHEIVFELTPSRPRLRKGLVCYLALHMKEHSTRLAYSMYSLVFNCVMRSYQRYCHVVGRLSKSRCAVLYRLFDVCGIEREARVF